MAVSLSTHNIIMSARLYLSVCEVCTCHCWAVGLHLADCAMANETPDICASASVPLCARRTVHPMNDATVRCAVCTGDAARSIRFNRHC